MPAPVKASISAVIRSPRRRQIGAMCAVISGPKAHRVVALKDEAHSRPIAEGLA
jgi:hypothetical protein